MIVALGWLSGLEWWCTWHPKVSFFIHYLHGRQLVFGILGEWIVFDFNPGGKLYTGTPCLGFYYPDLCSLLLLCCKKSQSTIVSSYY